MVNLADIDVAAVGEQIGVIITMLITLVGVITTLVIALKNKTKVGEIHEQVNSNLQVTADRVEQLTRVISDAPHVDLPPTPPDKRTEGEGP
jgi:hypothetical protein